MTRDEFKLGCWASGYCSPSQAVEYMGDRQEFTEDDWTELYNEHGGVQNGWFTILGKEYIFTFTGYIQGKLWCASVNFNESTGLMNQGGTVYNLQIFMSSTGYTVYYLRELHSRVIT